MKKHPLLFPLVVLLFCTAFTTSKKGSTTTCDIVNFYKAVEPEDRDTKVLTPSGDLEAVDLILVPTKPEIRTYKVMLSRKGSNLYKVDQANLYIETNYCVEFPSDKEVTLIVKSSYGVSKGSMEL
ncbi:hypothetical protein [Flavobacterium sp. N1994]|uniref:hypothetical protein n=1 Tax=Flavobacterium sp. N1994 TaxID=2986827 RepID=UPI002223AD22|nr:hypothetical protein [Flavobacterium sp. N1994]